MKRWVERTESWLARPAAGGWLLAAVAAAYAIAYVRHDLFPGFGAEAATRGWWTWADQSEYLSEAHALAHGRIDAETYSYPLGYAALAAPFVRWMPAHAFFVPDLTLVLVAAAMWWRLARRWLGAAGAVATGAVFLATHGWLVADTIVVPWNTLVTLCTLPAAIWLVTGGRGAKVLWAVAGLAAGTYLVRPVDALGFGPLLIVATGRLPTWRQRAANGMGAAAVLVAAWVAVGALNLAVFDSWRTPYEAASLRVSGFFGYPAGWKAFWLLLDGLPFFGETEPGLAWRYPWLFLAIPAAVWWVRRERWAGVAGVAAVGLSAGTYLNYNDLLPSDLYRFTLVHYLTWWFPLLFAVVVAAIRHGWRDSWVRGGLALSAGLLAVCTGLRMEPRMDEAKGEGGAWRLPATRPLIVEAVGLPKEAVKGIRLDGNALLEPAEYVTRYVGGDCTVLLGNKATGERLSFVEVQNGTETLRIGTLHWTWRISVDRVRKVGRWIFRHAWR